MPTNYPGSLDSLTNPVGTDTLDSPDHAGQHANANDAIEAIQFALGTDPKGAAADVSARIAALETVIDAHFGVGLTYSDIANGTANGGTTITVTPTAAPASGDLVVFCVAGHNVIPNSAGPTQGTGAAWTERMRIDTDGNEWVAVYTKIANSTEPATYQITTSSATTTLSGAAVAILRGPTTFVRSGITAGLTAYPVEGEPEGIEIICWVSALAAGTLFSVSGEADLTQHVVHRVATSEPAFLIASKPTTHAFPQRAYVVAAPGITTTWTRCLAMVWE